MLTDLQGRKVAFVTTPDAVGASTWRRALEEAGAVVEEVGRAEVTPSLDYQALVAIGGTGDGPADRAPARGMFPREAVQLLKELMSVDKPVVLLGGAVGLLAEADVARGRRVSAPPGLRDALESAGAHVGDDALLCDERLWTSRSAETEPAGLVGELGGAVTQLAADRTSEQSFPASDPPPGPSHI